MKSFFVPRRKIAYIILAIFLLFSTMMHIIAGLESWPTWVTVFVASAGAVMIALTFFVRIKERVLSFIAVTLSMTNIFLFSWMSMDLFSCLNVVLALAIVITIYMDSQLLFYLSGLSILTIGVHMFVLDSVDFSTEGIVMLVLRLVTLIFAELFLVVFIRQIKRIQLDLKNSLEDAKAAERSKSDFLANTSHEIRTPMNAIMGMCELILREQDINDSVRENCFNIQSSGRSLLAIINDILDFSKIESGKMEIIESEFNIASLLNDVINMTVTRKGNKKIEIMVHADPDIPCGLIGDEIRIRQVMVNLMTNAVKFTNSGAVTLHVTQTRQDYGINLKIAVEDTGIGISEENLEQLFESFQQIDTRKNRSIEGTGLGLAISKRLVTRMGGFINVTSTYGRGSVFSFVLPMKVSDDRPFITVNEPEKIMSGVFIDFDKFDDHVVEEQYLSLIDEISEQLKVRVKRTAIFEEIEEMIENDVITHCFIGKEEYLAHKEYFIKAATKICVTLIQDIIDPVKIPGNIRCIYKPFYTMSAAAALNNERITLNLNERRGSTISFSAPKARVLIVDDNAINLKVAVGLMQPYHMQIMTVQSGKDALAMLRSKDIDIVFMDHMMPGMDGVETTKLIRAMDGEYYKKLPIIALTANAVSGVREMFIENGLNDFIAKPIELSALDRLLKAWLPRDYIMAPTNLAYGKNERRKNGAAPVYKDGEHISITKGMYYAGGSEEAYYEILDMYVRKGEDKIRQMNSLVEQEEWKDYTIEVHALKSTSLSIGAAELSEYAKNLELAGKSGDYDIIVKNNDSLMELFGKVLEEGRRLLGEKMSSKEETPEEEVACEEISEDDLIGILDKIKMFCSDFDSDEIAALSKEASKYSFGGISLSSYFRSIESSASDFEYDDAYAMVEKLMTELGIKRG